MQTFGWSGLNVTVFAIEQTHTKVVLDGLNAAAECGLAQMYSRSGACEMPLLSECNDVVQMSQFHSGDALVALE